MRSEISLSLRAGIGVFHLVYTCLLFTISRAPRFTVFLIFSALLFLFVSLYLRGELRGGDFFILFIYTISTLRLLYPLHSVFYLSLLTFYSFCQSTYFPIITATTTTNALLGVHAPVPFVPCFVLFLFRTCWAQNLYSFLLFLFLIFFSFPGFVGSVVWLNGWGVCSYSSWSLYAHI